MKKGVTLPLLVLAMAALSLTAISCKRKNAEALAAGVPALADDKAGVCLIGGLGVRAEVGKNAKFLSSLALGEGVKWTGSTQKDESGREYLKVELSDGKSGWVAASGLATGAQIGAMREESISYKRPDLLTASPLKIPVMTIVAVIQQKDDWFQIIGEAKKPLGWVRKDSVTVDKEDVTVATLATRKLREKDGLSLDKKIDAIVKISPNPDSFFIQKLREKAASAASEMAVPPPAPLDAPAQP